MHSRFPEDLSDLSGPAPLPAQCFSKDAHRRLFPRHVTVPQVGEQKKTLCFRNQGFGTPIAKGGFFLLDAGQARAGFFIFAMDHKFFGQKCLPKGPLRGAARQPPEANS